MSSSKRLFCAIWVGFLLVGCSAPRPPVVPTPTAAVLPAVIKVTSTVTASTTATVIPSTTPTQVQPTAMPTPPFAMCSPLEGITLAEMGAPDLLKNPFVAPRPGMDDGHHGADFAYWSRGDRKTMLGLPVYSVLNGQVAAVIHNRQPYGNAVIIETSLQSLPASFLQSLAVPTPEPTISPIPNLVCPADSTDYAKRPGRSLYLLYAHFNLDPLVQLGQVITCGQPIGEVGTTGKSVNPHLHLETRVGPAGATFASLSHYDTSATEAERAAYCTWRVSGLFEMFDPMKLLSLQP